MLASEYWWDVMPMLDALYDMHSTDGEDTPQQEEHKYQNKIVFDGYGRVAEVKRRAE